MRREEDTVQLIENLIGQVNQARQELIPVWERSWKWYIGEQYKLKRNKRKVMSNRWYAIIQHDVALQASSDPRISVLAAEEPFFTPGAKKLSGAFNSDWQRFHWNKEVRKAVRYLRLFDSVVGKAFFDENVGSPRFQALKPRDVYFIDKIDNLEESPFVIHEGYVPLYNFLSQFEKKQEAYKKLFDTDTVRDEDLYGKNILVWDVYLRPNRHILICDKRKVVLDEEIAMDGYPFVLAVHTEQDTQSLGIPLFNQIESLQRGINESINHIILRLAYEGIGQWVADFNSLVEGQIHQRPGEAILVQPGTRVERLQMAPLSNTVVMIYNQLGREIELASGATDVSFGIKPGSVTAAETVRSLIAQSAFPSELMSQILQGWLEGVGQKLLPIYQYVYFGPDAEARDLLVPHSVSPFKITTGHDPEVLEGKYRITIEPGAIVTKNKSAFAQLALQVYPLGFVDNQWMLEALGLPGLRELMARQEQGFGAQRISQPIGAQAGGQAGGQAGAQNDGAQALMEQAYLAGRAEGQGSEF